MICKKNFIRVTNLRYQINVTNIKTRIGVYVCVNEPYMFIHCRIVIDISIFLCQNRMCFDPLKNFPFS